MDVLKTPEQRNKQKNRKVFMAGSAVILLSLFIFMAMAIKPALPTIAESAIWDGTVKRGEMLRRVRGNGTLVPEENRWLTAANSGLVAALHLEPGASVQPGTPILTLANPDLEFEAREAESRVQAARAELEELRFQLEQRILDRKAALARARTDYEVAKLVAERDRALQSRGLHPDLDARISEMKARSLAGLMELEKQQLQKIEASVSTQLQSKQARVAQLEDAARLKNDRAEGLQIRADIAGILQELPLEIGQRVEAGAVLARIADTTRLKAVIRVPQSRTRDLQPGLICIVDTHSGEIPARISRIDPTVKDGMVSVDMALEGPLPKIARPDLAVEGIIEIERIPDTLYVDKPVHARGNADAQVFKLASDGSQAVRTLVRFGRQSVTTIEIVAGLAEGDRIILSDTSAYNNSERIAVQ